MTSEVVKLAVPLDNVPEMEIAVPPFTHSDEDAFQAVLVPATLRPVPARVPFWSRKILLAAARCVPAKINMVRPTNGLGPPVRARHRINSAATQSLTRVQYSNTQPKTIPRSFQRTLFLRDENLEGRDTA